MTASGPSIARSTWLLIFSGDHHRAAGRDDEVAIVMPEVHQAAIQDDQRAEGAETCPSSMRGVLTIGI
jgi:hypothetical protein